MKMKGVPIRQRSDFELGLDGYLTPDRYSKMLKDVSFILRSYSITHKLSFQAYY